MQRFVRGFIILLALAAPAASVAQEASEVREQAPADRQATGKDKDAAIEQGLATLAPTTCFSSGSGSAFLKVCLSAHGNITWLESPADVVHINGREGYAVCKVENAVGLTVFGFDANVASDGWGPPTVSDNGRIITRTSLDGAVLLKQAFNILPAQRGVDVKMEVKNLTPLDLGQVIVTRYFDGDIDGDVSNRYFYTNESALAMEARGVMLTASPSPKFLFAPQVSTFQEWDPLGAGQRYGRGCGGNLVVTGQQSDYVWGLATNLGVIKPGQTRSVTLHYRRF